MAKLAVELAQAVAARTARGGAGALTTRVLAQGRGWSVVDAICTSGPEDQPFEEAHVGFSISIVAAGSFQYKSRGRREVLTPGSLLLGTAGQCFVCGHEHAQGDRCISFGYTPSYFERLGADAGYRGRTLRFDALRVPPVRTLAPIVASASAGAAGDATPPWEELSVRIAARALELVGGLPAAGPAAPVQAESRVTRAVRAIERDPSADHSLGELSRRVRLSPFHFLRTFERVTGVTPHQYVLRARLREAAARLLAGSDRILDIALDAGFGDISNFTRAFHVELGKSPREYRTTMRKK